jgi:hypothetical protein
MNKILLHHHLGLGDHIICNGLVRFLSINTKIDLFCKDQNLNNIKLMYNDNKEINVIGIYNDFEAERIANGSQNYIRLGVGLNHNYPRDMETQWDKVFYHQMNVDFDHSWISFEYNKPISQNSVPSKPYSFLCNQGSDGIDRLDYTKIDHSLQKVYSNSGNFFDNIDLIQNATEIHCINSSYIHLIDRIETPENTKLVYHKNFMYKNHSDFILKKDWIVV